LNYEQIFVSPGLNSIQKGYDEAVEEGKVHLYLMSGTHKIQANYVCIEIPRMKIMGAGRNKTFIRGGGFKISGKKKQGWENRVELSDMTVGLRPYLFQQRQGSNGMFGDKGLSFLCKEMTLTYCAYSGVRAETTTGRLVNCVVTKCAMSGICCGENALVEVEGSLTKVDGNVTSGGEYHSGLKTLKTDNKKNSMSKIHLLSPLTKELVSTNNKGKGNWGGDGVIQTVESF